jgi:hypothetical protein
MAAITPTRDELFHRARRQGTREHPDAYTFDALVHLAMEITGDDGLEHNGACPPAGVPGSPSPSTLRHAGDTTAPARPTASPAGATTPPAGDGTPPALPTASPAGATTPPDSDTTPPDSDGTPPALPSASQPGGTPLASSDLFSTAISGTPGSVVASSPSTSGPTMCDPDFPPEPDPPPRATPEPSELDSDPPASPDCSAAGKGRRRRRKRRGAPVKLLIRVDYDTWVRGFALTGETCELVGYGPIPVSVARDLCATGDPFVAAILTKGRALVGVAHLGRHPTAFQQTALEWLYPTCAAQGCTVRARLERDHELDWSRTHFTMLDHLDLLCRHHHRLKTVHNWGLVDGRGKRAFVSPQDPRHPRYGARPETAKVAAPSASGGETRALT